MGSAPIKVLICDDDAGFRAALRLLFERDERAEPVAEAANGSEALTLALLHRPDVVTMDIEMPLMDGVEATRALRVLAPQLPVVAISGHDYEERVLEIRAAGASDYVRKARVGDDLPAALMALLDG
jgi:DNA-binding NarL/FixJ family response regulator